MATPVEAVYRLKCSCNQYPWGKTGKESVAARLCEQQGGWDGDGPKHVFKIDDSKPYAEMWFGTYPELPSYIADTGENLQDVIDRYPEELIGEQTIKKFGHSNLPYLPKVLSIAKALPLQLHPNKDKAAELHKKRPDAFTDPNHKPEIAIALGQFEAFCGFKELHDIKSLLELEPLQHFVPNGQLSNFTDEQLKAVVRNMLTADDATIKKTYSGLISLDKSKFGNQSYIPELAPRLAEQYSEADPGVLVALITMNYLVLQKGDSIYIPADGIHAYLAGDIIECMARSNNVLNTGFCPKSERSNVDTFMECLTFTPHSAQDAILKPQSYNRSKSGRTQLYAPPMSEFDMLQTALAAGESETLGAAGGPSMLIATGGNGSLRAKGKEYELTEGSVYYVTPDIEITMTAKDAGLLVHTAFVEGSTK